MLLCPGLPGELQVILCQLSVIALFPRSLWTMHFSSFHHIMELLSSFNFWKWCSRKACEHLQSMTIAASRSPTDSSHGVGCDGVFPHTPELFTHNPAQVITRQLQTAQTGLWGDRKQHNSQGLIEHVPTKIWLVCKYDWVHYLTP